jgi:hypothetical protein
MKYQDWKECFVDHTKDPADFLKVIETVEEVAEVIKSVLKPVDFVPASTIEEAEEFARINFVEEKTWSGNGNVSFKGLTIESANEINQTLYELFESYDMRKLSNIEPMNFRKDIWKGCETTPLAYRNLKNGELYFNPKIIKNRKLIDSYYEEGKSAYEKCKNNIDRFTGKDRELIETYVKAGRSLVSGDVDDHLKAMIQHEVGHHIENSIFYKDKDAVEIIKSGFEEYAIRISGYATKTYGEYIAESFCSYLNETELDKIDPKLKKCFERLMK